MEKKENQNEIYRKISDEKINETLEMIERSAKKGKYNYPGIVKGLLNNLKGKTIEPYIEVVMVGVNLLDTRELMTLHKAIGEVIPASILADMFDKGPKKGANDSKDVPNSILEALFSTLVSGRRE